MSQRLHPSQNSKVPIRVQTSKAEYPVFQNDEVWGGQIASLNHSSSPVTE